MTKVSELTEAKLDYWVAKALGYAAHINVRTLQPDLCIATIPPFRGLRVFQPSTDWSDGGPIIQRERIGLEQACPGDVYAYMPDAQLYGYSADTPLVAAMWALVASKFGNEVPDE